MIFSFLAFFSTGTIFLCFTLHVFCIFYALALKKFTIFHLIEKALLAVLSALGIFSLCSSTESTNKAISDCATLFNAMYSQDVFEITMDQKVDVCFFCCFHLNESIFKQSFIVVVIFIPTD
jgi:hypothetical protein